MITVLALISPGDRRSPWPRRERVQRAPAGDAVPGDLGGRSPGTASRGRHAHRRRTCWTAITPRPAPPPWPCVAPRCCARRPARPSRQEQADRRPRQPVSTVERRSRRRRRTPQSAAGSRRRRAAGTGRWCPTAAAAAPARPRHAEIGLPKRNTTTTPSPMPGGAEHRAEADDRRADGQREQPDRPGGGQVAAGEQRRARAARRRRQARPATANAARPTRRAAPTRIPRRRAGCRRPCWRAPSGRYPEANPAPRGSSGAPGTTSTTVTGRPPPDLLGCLAEQGGHGGAGAGSGVQAHAVRGRRRTRRTPRGRAARRRRLPRRPRR